VKNIPSSKHHLPGIEDSIAFKIATRQTVSLFYSFCHSFQYCWRKDSFGFSYLDAASFIAPKKINTEGAVLNSIFSFGSREEKHRLSKNWHFNNKDDFDWFYVISPTFAAP
jgi:hypothetical protein